MMVMVVAGVMRSWMRDEEQKRMRMQKMMA